MGLDAGHGHEARQRHLVGKARTETKDDETMVVTGNLKMMATSQKGPNLIQSAVYMGNRGSASSGPTRRSSCTKFSSADGMEGRLTAHFVEC